jgi:hypothetical protein
MHISICSVSLNFVFQQDAEGFSESRDFSSKVEISVFDKRSADLTASNRTWRFRDFSQLTV